MSKLKIETLKEIFDYDLDRGVLWWKQRPVRLFSNSKNPSHAMNVWNAQNSGNLAIDYSVKGYKVGSTKIDGVIYKLSAHRVLWALREGKWPENEIDHINHIRHDNRLENLREVTKLENSQNVGMHKTNKSGITGVSHRLVKGEWNGKWRAIVWNDGVRKYLGDFSSKEEAIIARQNYLMSIKTYHGNHGK